MNAEPYQATCPDCNQRTEVNISESALGAVANCECGNSFYISAETGEKPDRRRPKS